MTGMLRFSSPGSLLFLILIGSLIGLWAPNRAEAQIECGLQMHFDKYVPYQRIRVDVVVRNRGAKPIIFQEDSEKARIEFIVKNQAGKEYKRTKSPLMSKPFTLRPQERKSHTFDLFSAYGVTREGNYEVTARFILHGRRFLSKPVFFDLESGHVVEKLEIFDPARDFRLMELAREDGYYMFLGVYAPKDRMVYGVYDLGRMARSFDPQMEVDGRGNLNILHAYQPDRFVHSVFTSQGVPLTQDNHRSEYGTPALKVNPGGSGRIINSRMIGARGR